MVFGGVSRCGFGGHLVGFSGFLGVVWADIRHISLNSLSMCGFGVNCKHAVADFRLTWILKPSF